MDTAEHSATAHVYVCGHTHPLSGRGHDIPKVGVEEWKRNSMGRNVDRNVLRHPQRAYVAGAISVPLRTRPIATLDGRGCYQQAIIIFHLKLPSLIFLSVSRNSRLSHTSTPVSTMKKTDVVTNPDQRNLRRASSRSVECYSKGRRSGTLEITRIGVAS